MTSESAKKTASTYEELKLYGVAVAFVPAAETPDAINVTCTPIAVSHKDRGTFEIMEDLRFKEQFSLTSALSTFDGFVKIVDCLDHVVTLQRQALAKYNLPYRPVALNVGVDGARPINNAALYGILFGSSKTKVSAPPVQEIRNDFFVLHPEGYAPYMAACGRLAQLSDSFSLYWNTYSPSQWIDEDLQPTKSDRMFLQLRRAINKGNERAHDLLYVIAEREGMGFGKLFTDGWENGHFSIPGPPGYASDKAMQDALPRHGAYLYWHPHYKEAFLGGFNAAFKGRFNNSIKLPLDPRSPPFTDPCADRVRDQLEIVDRKRLPENMRDEVASRLWIAKMAKIESQSPKP